MLSASDVIIVVSNQMNAGDAARISISNELLEGQYSVQLTQKKRGQEHGVKSNFVFFLEKTVLPQIGTTPQKN